MKYLFPRLGLEGVVERISKSNALYPLLIADTFAVFFAITVLFVSENDWLRFAAFIPFSLISLQVIRSFDFFARNNPDMLRSETHVVQMQALTILGDEKNQFPGSAADLVALANPNNPPTTADILLEPVNVEVRQKGIDQPEELP